MVHKCEIISVLFLCYAKVLRVAVISVRMQRGIFYVFCRVAFFYFNFILSVALFSCKLFNSLLRIFVALLLLDLFNAAFLLRASGGDQDPSRWGGGGGGELLLY